MKQILPIICFIILCSYVNAGILDHANVSTVNVAKVTGNFDSFSWSWLENNSQTCTVYVVNGTNAVDLSTYGLSFKLAREGDESREIYILTTNITATSTYITFAVDRTNVPSGGSYRAELFGWQGSTNLTRSLFQGMVNVMKSLF